MVFGGRKALIFLFVGDLAAFVFSLWLTLLLRYAELPPRELIVTHLAAFAPIFAVWCGVFYMSGLYGKRATLLIGNIPSVLVRTHLFNIILAALYFFFFPVFGLAPKTTLILYLVVSLASIYLWRRFGFPNATANTTRTKAILIGEGSEVDELVSHVNNHPRYHLMFTHVIAPSAIQRMHKDALKEKLEQRDATLLVVDAESDTTRPLLPLVYELCFTERKYQFADFYQVYEEVFDRVPLSFLRYDWFLKHITHPTFGVYAIIKRALDLVGAVAMGLVTLLVLPLVWVAMRLEDNGPLFITQKRIGQYGVRMVVYKFRSMKESDAGAWAGEGVNRITRVGALLRLTSLDEFPQFLNVLKGELSLIGPRNDIEVLGNRLADAIPYYNIRYVVRPGITGWAQINQQYEQGKISPQSVEETKVRLAYDFYYIKNRSLPLDIVIALRTIKRMMFRVSAL